MLEQGPVEMSEKPCGCLEEECSGQREQLACCVLDQASENCSPWTKSDPPTVFVNKVLLLTKHSHARCLHLIYGFFWAMATELSSFNRNLIAFKALTIWYLKKLYKTSFPTLALKTSVGVEWKKSKFLFFFFFCKGMDFLNIHLFIILPYELFFSLLILYLEKAHY